MNIQCFGAARTISFRGRAAAFAGIACAAAALSGPCLADDSHQVPLVEFLTVMTAIVSENQGDYEAVKVFRDLTPATVRITVSAEAPDDSGEVREITVTRVVRHEDLRNAKVLRTYFHEFDALELPGTAPMFSAAMVNDVRSTGQTRATYLEIEPEFGAAVVSRTMTGTLKRVAAGALTVTLPVNGEPQALRALHVAGRLADDGDGADFDYVVLDDPDNPLILRAKGPGFSTSVTRIEFPVPTAAAGSLENRLAKDRQALVYGIYFKFNRADIRPVSEPVLQEIATILKKNPDWKLTIVGHTDNVGRDAANLDLSRRRAQSVKTALVERYAINGGRLTTGGFGASQPQAKNDTPEGRARNRRVELTRQ
jgi:outer membrane protein OmpA-like peptidoglycan-associated protein